MSVHEDIWHDCWLDAFDDHEPEEEDRINGGCTAHTWWPRVERETNDRPQEKENHDDKS